MILQIGKISIYPRVTEVQIGETLSKYTWPRKVWSARDYSLLNEPNNPCVKLITIERVLIRWFEASSRVAHCVSFWFWDYVCLVSIHQAKSDWCRNKSWWYGGRGSVASREFIATYIQDECTLQVIIQVPSNFPRKHWFDDIAPTLSIFQLIFKVRVRVISMMQWFQHIQSLPITKTIPQATKTALYNFQTRRYSRHSAHSISIKTTFVG